MVFLKIRNQDNSLNNIEIVRLKDKLGTRQLPTAELILRGTEALQISEVGKGIKYISNMLNITRIHNAIASVSFMRRIITLVLDYSSRRKAFGKKIINHKLHLNTIEEMDYSNRGCLAFLLQCSLLL